MTARIHAWLKASGDAWQSGSIELIVSGPSAVSFHQWYADAMSCGWEIELRACHPEHFVSHPVDDGGEVIENIGETELPWHIFYRNLAGDADIPSAWISRFPVHFAAEIVDAEGMRVGYSIRKLRDDEDGCIWNSRVICLLRHRRGCWNGTCAVSGSITAIGQVSHLSENLISVL